ncbi:MAG: hypothetical protein KGY61_04245 [Desulfobacterales bacterium]|nr:hypothetical protein [Desulfobacterales bacterium]HMB41037.1 hypothetical protein [Balneolaceae bacterium]
MENYASILIPNIAIACYVGRWLIRKPRDWKPRIIVSTLPFLPVAVLCFFIATYTEILTIDNILSIIVGFWICYLLITWSWPLVVHFHQIDIRRLRKAAIQNMGWIAGNAAGVSSWQSYVGEGSPYYNALMESNDNGTQVSADLYNRGWKEGRKHPYNENACNKKYRKIVKLSKKSNRYTKELRKIKKIA